MDFLLRFSAGGSSIRWKRSVRCLPGGNDSTICRRRHAEFTSRIVDWDKTEAGKTRIELTEGWTADEEEPGPLSPAILWRKDWDALDNGTLVAVGSCRRGERPGGSPEKEKISNLLLLFYLWLLLALPLSVHRLIEVTAEPHPPTGFGNYPSALHEGASEIMGMICKALLVLREISQRLAFVSFYLSVYYFSNFNSK